jgi:hypothetical protein
MSHTLSLDYPEGLPDALHRTRAEFEREARLALAAKRSRRASSARGKRPG